MNNSIKESVNHNTYFEGKVQSLELETLQGKATLGVMKKGCYTFSTSSEEKITLITGIMNVKVKDGAFRKYVDQEEFLVEANSSFEVKCDSDVAYLCYYK